MGSLQDDIPKGQPAPTDFQEEANIYEDEINLIDYFGVPWKRKYLLPFLKRNFRILSFLRKQESTFPASGFRVRPGMTKPKSGTYLMETAVAPLGLVLPAIPLPIVKTKNWNF